MSDPHITRRNWLITDRGDCLNLDFLSKVMWGGNFEGSPQPLKVYYYHGVSEGKGAVLAYNYATDDEAEDAYDAVRQLLLKEAIANDMRPYPFELADLDVATGPAAGGTTVVVNGNLFSNRTVIKFGGVAATGLVLEGSGIIHCVTPAHAAGAVDVTAEDFEADGTTPVVSTLAAAYTYT